ncbi:hypothetical protein BGX30_000876 [Mortierella sp. GBA39]|nr:hypothetical protein BGX30_000876 [Mortierella sp. GBA39]
MSLKGQHLEPLAPTSPEFLQYQAVFGRHKLVKLYKIIYETMGTHSLDKFNPYPSIFFHGTGHCGCVSKRFIDTDLASIDASNWCGGTCATQGILNHGHLLTYSKGGHFFSPNWTTAHAYAMKKPILALSSVFLVKARYNIKPNIDICSVQNDTHHESERSAPRAPAPTSANFIKYQTIFGADRLAKMYKIVYKPDGTHTLDQFSGFPSLYFRGTGHSGCLLKRGVDTGSTRINSNDGV